MQSQLLSLEQQLQTLTDGQTKLGQDVAALKAAAPSSSSAGATEARAGSSAGQQAADSPAASSKGAAGSSSPDLSTGAGAAQGPAGLQGRDSVSEQPGTALGNQNGHFGQRLDALADEVRLLAFCIGDFAADDSQYS